MMRRSHGRVRFPLKPRAAAGIASAVIATQPRRRAKRHTSTVTAASPRPSSRCGSTRAGTTTAQPNGKNRGEPSAAFAMRGCQPSTRASSSAATTVAAQADAATATVAPSGRRAAQDHRLQAVSMVEMGMHRRHGQVVMVVLEPDQPVGQLALVVVEDIGQTGHALAGGVAGLLVRFEPGAKQVADRLGPVGVAAGRRPGVELACQGIVERNRQSFHIVSLLSCHSCCESSQIRALPCSRSTSSPTCPRTLPCTGASMTIRCASLASTPSRTKAMLS